MLAVCEQNGVKADSITGIPPGGMLLSSVSLANQRSTVGTSTEVYDYLRMLYV